MSFDTVTFEIDIPPGWRQIDLLSTESKEVLPEQIARALTEASELGQHGRLLLARALMASAPGTPPVSAGLVATLADPEAAPPSVPLDPGGFGEAEVSAVELAIGSGLRIRNVSSKEILADLVAPAFLCVQNLLATEQGLLTLTFTTAQGDPTADWEALFAAMAATSRFV